MTFDCDFATDIDKSVTLQGLPGRAGGFLWQAAKGLGQANHIMDLSRPNPIAIGVLQETARLGARWHYVTARECEFEQRTFADLRRWGAPLQSLHCLPPGMTVERHKIAVLEALRPRVYLDDDPSLCVKVAKACPWLVVVCLVRWELVPAVLRQFEEA